jgi:hypothetical protein
MTHHVFFIIHSSVSSVLRQVCIHAVRPVANLTKNAKSMKRECRNATVKDLVLQSIGPCVVRISWLIHPTASSSAKPVCRNAASSCFMREFVVSWLLVPYRITHRIFFGLDLWVLSIFCRDIKVDILIKVRPKNACSLDLISSREQTTFQF